MSATADAGLFASYFETALGQPSGQLTIPGFTHPVTGAAGRRHGRAVAWRGVAMHPRTNPLPVPLCSRLCFPLCSTGGCRLVGRWVRPVATTGSLLPPPFHSAHSLSLSSTLTNNRRPSIELFFCFFFADFFLEDAFEATGFAVGRGSKWAHRAGGKEKQGGGGGGGGGDAEGGGGGGGGAAAELAGYSEQTRISLQNVDEGLINTGTLLELCCTAAGTDCTALQLYCAVLPPNTKGSGRAAATGPTARQSRPTGYRQRRCHVLASACMLSSLLNLCGLSSNHPPCLIPRVHTQT